MENTRKNLMHKAANHQAEADIQLLGMRVAAALVVENAPTLYPEDRIACIVYRLTSSPFLGA